ncbi:MAG TPA: serine--tRNA ligase [Candidatus Saccharimonadales bacterium]|nr:serine--tRNA ligase [Candidatus Saccharimonadales bacterium]
MLDIQFIRDNAELVKQKSKQKGYEVDIDQLLQLDIERRTRLTQVEELRKRRNDQAAELKNKKPSEEQIAGGKQLKEEISQRETELQQIEAKYLEILQSIPNVIPDDTPEGGEENNCEEKKWGEPRQDEVKDHLTWGEERGLIDFERGAKVAGAKFYYLKGGLVPLELAVFQFGLQLAAKHGFTPMTVPHLVSSRTVSGTGFMAKGDEQQIYKIEGEDLNLIATAEIPITGYHADEIVKAAELPILYAGLSPAYRREAGAYGKHSKGLYRVHQFNKLELYVFCKPEDSESWHQKLVQMEEELCQALEIPYRLVRIAAGDLGLSAYKKFDVEYWSPAEKTYRELMSCSNVTDYQARRLNIRYKDETGKTQFVHTLNGTAAAFSRLCIALIENHQKPDGKVQIPAALHTFMSGQTEI